MTVLLFLAAFLGGALNSVAGGGSFIALPALLFAGVPPVSANATTTFAMWPGSVASVVAYRREMTGAWARMLRLGVVSLAGGLIGGLLLVKTSDESFMRLLPWLMLLAATTFTFGGRMTAWVRRRRPRPAPPLDPAHETGTGRDAGESPAAARSPQVPMWTLPLQLLIATYGGYFGGGMGIMMLAAMAVAGMTDMHEMNGLKSLLAVAINGVALAAFIVDGAISWAPGMVMVAGGITGGYVGASMARRVSGPAVRVVVITVAWAMTGYFFLR